MKVAELELKMLRFTSGVTCMGKIRNQHIKETTHVEWFGVKVEK